MGRIWHSIVVCAIRMIRTGRSMQIRCAATQRMHGMNPEFQAVPSIAYKSINAMGWNLNTMHHTECSAPVA